jgi:alkanesulfonate monooxygenase SsuD/methylene tetrahydromethanopterin reductase-like flavin-dependent oxidoreductase (luciferase family)
VGGREADPAPLAAQYADKCNVTGDVDNFAHKIEVLHRHCFDVGRNPAEVDITWMTPLILTSSDQNTAEVRRMLAASESPDEVARSPSASLTRFQIWSPVISKPEQTK